MPLATVHLPPKEESSSLPATSPLVTAHLPPKEGSSSSQAIAHLSLGEGSNSLLATVCLPPKEGSSSLLATSLLATAHLPPEEGSSSSQATAHLPLGEGNRSPHAGQSSNQTRLGRQGFRHSTGHRANQASQENSTISWEENPPPPPPPVGFPKGLLMKNLTLSWSLTFPANP